MKSDQLMRSWPEKGWSGYFFGKEVKGALNAHPLQKNLWTVIVKVGSREIDEEISAVSVRHIHEFDSRRFFTKVKICNKNLKTRLSFIFGPLIVIFFAPCDLFCAIEFEYEPHFVKYAAHI